MPPRVFVAGALVIQGTLMLLAGASDFSASGYAVVFDIMGRNWWGLLFVVSGLGLLVARSPITLGASVAVLFGWAVGLNAAYWTGDGTTPTAGLPWLCLGLLMLWAAGRPQLT